jgi:hypothetical protein
MNRRTLNGPRMRAAPYAPPKRGSYYSDSSEESDDESSEEDFDDDIPNQDGPTRLCHAFSRQRSVFTLRINREHPERSREEREALIEGLCIDFELQAQRPKQGAESASFFSSTQWVTCLDQKDMAELEANMRCFSQFVEEANRTLLRKTVAGVKSSLRLLLGVCADANTSSEDTQKVSSIPVDICQQHDRVPMEPIAITRVTSECNLSTQVEVIPTQLGGKVLGIGSGQPELTSSSEDGPVPHVSVVLPTSFARPRLKTWLEPCLVDADPNGSVCFAGVNQQFYLSLGAIDFFQCSSTEECDPDTSGSVNPVHRQDCHQGVTPMKEVLVESTSSPLGLPEVKGAYGCKLFISSEKLEFDEEPIRPFGSFLLYGRKEIPVGEPPPVPIQPDPG